MLNGVIVLLDKTFDAHYVDLVLKGLTVACLLVETNTQ